MDKKKRNKRILHIVSIALIVLAIIYLNGLLTQLIMKFFLRVRLSLRYDPITCFKFAFWFKYSMYAWIAMGVLALLLAGYMFTMSDRRGKLDSGITKDDAQNFEYSGKDNYGSAHMMEEKEVRKNYRVVKSNVQGISETNGAVLFGFLNDKKKEIVSMPESDWRKGTDFNRNIAVCGPPGSNKTRGFVMNYVIQKLLAGESIIVVDTKGELYAKTYPFAKSLGYKGKILNLIEQDCSDGWDILGEVKNDPDMSTELASTVIRNTGGSKSDPFWNDAELNLLKAVILLKSVGQADISNVLGKKQTMGDVYKYIATRPVTVKSGGGESMEADFAFLREYIPNHPAITPFLQFMNAGEDICKKIVHGLANRLQLFQNAQLCNVLGTKDIDLEEAGKQRCIYYLRFSDQTSTYAFITALFFSFLSVKLVQFADSCPERKLPVPVNLVLDEFCNIGAIPDFEIKMATFRSRMINVVLIYQNNMLFETTYPNGLWEAILATCDTLVVLGVGNELTTSKYVSEMTGEATTSVSSASLTSDTGQLRTTSSSGKRFVRMPNEIRCLKSRHALVFVRSYQVMETVKMDYTENPIYLENKEIFDKEVSVIDHHTIVEKVDINYEDFVINEIVRDNYKNQISPQKPLQQPEDATEPTPPNNKGNNSGNKSGQNKRDGKKQGVMGSGIQGGSFRPHGL